MDNMTNNIAADKPLVCPQCGKNNKAVAKFCVGCGFKFEQPAPAAAAFAPVEEKTSTVAFAPAEEKKEEPVLVFAPAEEKKEEAAPVFAPAEPEKEAAAPVFTPAEDKKDAAPAFAPEEKKEAVANPVVTEVKYVAPEDAFAKGLPSWSVEPPQVMVRRRKK